MNRYEQMKAVSNYSQYGTPIPSQAFAYVIQMPSSDPQRVLGYAASAMKTILSRERPGPLWQFLHDVMPCVKYPNSWFFKAYAAYSWNREAVALTGGPLKHAYLHVACVGESAGDKTELVLFFKDDLAWLFPYPKQIMEPTINAIPQFLQAYSIQSSIIVANWTDPSNFP